MKLLRAGVNSFKVSVLAPGYAPHLVCVNIHTYTVKHLHTSGHCTSQKSN